MIPNQNEGKQDFLKRCTQVEIKNGKNHEQAFAVCNVTWDNEKNQRSALCLTAPVELKNTQAKNEQKSFLITVYTGQPVDTWRGKLVIDVSGIQTKAKIPILREHLRDRVVGSGKTWKKGNILYAGGIFSQKTKDGIEVLALAEEGYPWQASMHVIPAKVKVLRDDKESETVNGFSIKGPAEIWQKSKVGEVSFVSLGADDQTAAISMQTDVAGMPVEIVYTQNFKKEEIIMQDHPQDFMSLVEQYRHAHSCSNSAAMKSIIKVHPDSHAAFLERHNPGLKVQTADVQIFPNNETFDMTNQEDSTNFMELVEKHKLLYKCSMSDAMQAVMKRNPAAHLAYLERHNPGRKFV